VHDRRIDGKTHTFGNAGTLFKNAMTWFDHETFSIWSQPWGRAIQGTYTGIELDLLPSQITTWSNWKSEHPNTLVMINEVEQLGNHRQGFGEDFVIGLVLAGKARAVYFTDARTAGVINDWVGEVPVVVWGGDIDYHSYIRKVKDQVLTFRVEGEFLIDKETGSKWNIVRGLAIEGPLEGESLQPVPSMSSFDWAFRDFYPDSDFYSP
jgi:hypothetical protein